MQHARSSGPQVCDCKRMILVIRWRLQCSCSISWELSVANQTLRPPATKYGSPIINDVWCDFRHFVRNISMLNQLPYHCFGVNGECTTETSSCSLAALPTDGQYWMIIEGSNFAAAESGSELTVMFG